MSTTEIRTPELDVGKIDVEEGFNSRQQMDETELAQLAATIKTDSLVQPLSVRPTKKGRFSLVTGHRRLEAAKRAGLKRVPVTVCTGNPRAQAFIENNHRANLNPIETALDLRALADEFGLTSNKQIAARAKKKAPWVADHLRLLRLPEAVQRYIASGDVPMGAEPKLRKIAEVSPAVAAVVCEVGKRNGISGAAFVERFADIFDAAGEEAIKGKPTMIRSSRFDLSEVVGDPEKHALLAERINGMAPTYGQEEDPIVRLGDPEVDAARAAGCLVEYRFERRGYTTTTAYIIDKEFAADLIERGVDRLEKERVAKAEAQVKAGEAAKARRNDDQTKLREERRKSGEETPQAKAKKRKAIARVFNDRLKRALLKKRTASRRKKFALARAQAVACQFISDNPKLAGRGLRLVSDQLQDLEVKPLKSGGRREKITYANSEQSTAELLRRSMGTKDPFEVLEVLSEALIAGLLADPEEVPGKDWIGWYSPVEGELKKLLASEIKEVQPRRTRKPV